MVKLRKAILYLVGFSLCLYPFISSMIEQHNLKDIVDTHEERINMLAQDKIQDAWEKADIYNSYLYQSKGNLIDGTIGEEITSEYYHKLLNVEGNGIMGSIEIPKINVKLPIYHGVSNEVLSAGVGHIEGTSLPVGGLNTKSVLTGHRGLPNSKLFTRLDELSEGDLFYLTVLNRVLAYEVTDIEVIRPDQVESLQIESEKDLVTLVTCTPYGINTHRLLVTGSRVEFVEKEYEQLEEVPASFREQFFVSLPIIFAGYGVIRVTKYIWKRRVKRY